MFTKSWVKLTEKVFVLVATFQSFWKSKNRVSLSFVIVKTGVWYTPCIKKGNDQKTTCSHEKTSLEPY